MRLLQRGNTHHFISAAVCFASQANSRYSNQHRNSDPIQDYLQSNSDLNQDYLFSAMNFQW